MWIAIMCNIIDRNSVRDGRQQKENASNKSQAWLSLQINAFTFDTNFKQWKPWKGAIECNFDAFDGQLWGLRSLWMSLMPIRIVFTDQTIVLWFTAKECAKESELLNFNLRANEHNNKPEK